MIFKLIILKFALFLPFVLSSTPSYSVYETSSLSGQSQYDCLYWANANYVILNYCIRPNDSETINFSPYQSAINGKRYAFYELYQLNISSYDFYQWSAPINLIEKYQMYHDNITNSLDYELYYNCSKPWFGTFCQYTLNSIESFDQIIAERFQSRIKYEPTDVIKITNGTCYTGLKCYRGPSPICLDWREICDGKVDCFDAEDEKYCSQLETNTCEKDQYLCQNGMCIPDSLINQIGIIPDCIDGSDEQYMRSFTDICYTELSPKCEEYSCTWNKRYSCGDGQCSDIPPPTYLPLCFNGRDLLHSRSQLIHTELSKLCWEAIICSLGFGRIFELLCVCRIYDFCTEIIHYECRSIFFFPFTSILDRHVRFVYTKNKTDWSTNVSPDYICYDELRCNFIKSTITEDTLKCRHFEKFDIDAKYNNWIKLFIDVQHIFKGCSHMCHNCLHSTLFHCPNSSKCISKTRLTDGYEDCYNQVDEHTNSCLLDLKHRTKCRSEDKCIPNMALLDGTRNCLGGEDEVPNFVCSSIELCHENDKTLFKAICNGSVEFSSILEATDETNCEEWPCRTQYTICDKT
ncbi:unnamed protein product [Didymodactylos carnosus]|uniref:Uncharacterized protein n=1 Tax=Didymodactylos carnosus TaxID=1234261 RepID=A0A8S2TY34_9BILA|nr:unnamed protein product [Didymodactylos carnosus]CAF4310993.1 unnamed protein product [Didymodactylos carnosus]